MYRTMPPRLTLDTGRGWLLATVMTASLYAPPTAAAQDLNPYRGQTSVHEAGRQSYNQHCAECHGNDARQSVAEAPDLRRMDSFCRRLKDHALKADCTADVDRYYLRSVHEGKVRAGVVHMPAWKGVLTPQEIWSIRTYVETRPMDPPKRTTSVDAQRVAGER